MNRINDALFKLLNVTASPFIARHLSPMPHIHLTLNHREPLVLIVLHEVQDDLQLFMIRREREFAVWRSFQSAAACSPPSPVQTAAAALLRLPTRDATESSVDKLKCGYEDRATPRPSISSLAAYRVCRAVVTRIW